MQYGTNNFVSKKGKTEAHFIQNNSFLIIILPTVIIYYD